MLKSVSGILGLCLLGSYTGALHPLGDSLAVFRLEWAVGFALVVIWTRWSAWLRWPLAGLAMGVIGHHVCMGQAAGGASDHDFVLYQQNLLVGREENERWLGFVEEVSPDFLTLQEVSPSNRYLLDRLKPEYPNQVYCPKYRYGEAVVTRFEPVPGTAFCSKRDGLAGMQVETPHGRVWIVSLHIGWPWPYGQSQQLTQILPELDRVSGHVIVGGDFNAVAWSDAVRRVEEASGTRRIGHWMSTFRIGWRWPIGIDHVLTSPAYAQEIRLMPQLGSDHFGVLAYLTRGRNG
ncbi:MAG: endonuclease/exonuclease/phosphatase family protein [Pelagimonas sp.]|nr:endonuclease/exonuclease/phosphatase family protein [Pelagimonas sp.]